MQIGKLPSRSTVLPDISAGIVVFLIALPLCLGIALASGAPLFSGLLAGIIGGLVVSSLSGSNVSVSGPAAGLTVIVASAIATLGSFQLLLIAIVLAGIFQVALGFLKAGTIAIYFPSSVIKGMLTAIGIILILKQIPHIFGYDASYFGDLSLTRYDDKNIIQELAQALQKFNPGASLTGIVSLLVLISWNFVPKALRKIPAALLVVVIGVGLNYLFLNAFPHWLLTGTHLVALPQANTQAEFISLFVFPDFRGLTNPNVYVVAFTLALVASLETLLSLEAVDKLDPLKRTSPANRELKAQGVGNMLSGMLGGLPITSVIVRGSANITAGAKTKLAAIVHGMMLFIAVLLFPSVINQIPLACLAAILLMIGYKLTKISLYREMYRGGWDQFIPFAVTIIAIVFTNLLLGIAIGLVVAIFFILRRNMSNIPVLKQEGLVPGEPIRIILAEEVSFLNKAAIQLTLDQIPNNASVIIDGRNSSYIDFDVLEIIENFKISTADRNILVEFLDVDNKFKAPVPSGARIYQQTYEKLLVNNRAWALKKVASNAEYFSRQAQQSPKYFLITCSDSRIMPSDLTGTGTGEIFVHRNIGNLVLDDDKSLLAALQYAVEVLRVEHIIVCGHYGCGGINAILENNAKGPVADWIAEIRTTYFKHIGQFDQLTHALRHHKLVDLNVLQQVDNLRDNEIIKNAMLSNQKLSIHGWAYDIQNGIVNELTT